MNDLVAQLRSVQRNPVGGLCVRAADRIEKLEARVLLLEGYLSGALNVIEGFVACDTKEARKALEGKDG
jgi:hypothetical protein